MDGCEDEISSLGKGLFAERIQSESLAEENQNNSNLNVSMDD